MMAWGADWPTGYGFLRPDRSTAAAIKRLGQHQPVGAQRPDGQQRLLDKAIAQHRRRPRVAPTGPRSTSRSWTDALIVPLVCRKDLLYRPESATNVHVSQGLGMYDYRDRRRSNIDPVEGTTRRLHRRQVKAGPVVPRTARARRRRRPPPIAVIAYIIRRLFAAVVLLLVVSVVTFLHLLRGPAPRRADRRTSLAAQYVGKDAEPAGDRGGQEEPRLRPADLRAVLGASSRAIFVGVHYNYGPATAHCPAPCFGYSFKTTSRSGPSIDRRLPVTLSLAAAAPR